MSGDSDKTIELSVLVPVRGPADDLPDLQREALAELEQLGVRYEIVYLVGAAGQGLETALQSRNDAPDRIKVLQFAQDADDAAILAAGFEATRGEIVLTLPAYFSTASTAIPELCAAIESGADLAFASRRQVSSADSSRLQSRLFNRLVSWATGTQFMDIASETRAMRREVLENVSLYGDYHRFLPILAERQGFIVRELPVRHHPREQVPRWHSPGVYLWRALDILSIFFLSRFTRRPLRLFGGVGSLFGLVGAAILLTVAIQRFLGTPLASRPILVLGTLLLGLGVQGITIGLLGELILFFHARKTRDYRIRAI